MFKMSCHEKNCKEIAVDYIQSKIKGINVIIPLCQIHINEYNCSIYKNSIEFQKSRRRRKPKWWYQSGLDRIGYPIIDHTYVYKEDDGSLSVVSNPYLITLNQLWKVIIRCEIFNINMFISNDSKYSNDTFRITFNKKVYGNISENINDLIKKIKK